MLLKCHSSFDVGNVLIEAGLTEVRKGNRKPLQCVIKMSSFADKLICTQELNRTSKMV